MKTPTKLEMAKMLSDYFTSENCWPHLWISYESFIELTPESKRLFIELAVQIRVSNVLLPTAENRK